MEGYLSIREAAEKWGVSERRVNQYCSEGRIPGAERFGTSWAIPETAEKPKDPRRKREECSSPQKKWERYSEFMPLMNTAFVPGECLKNITAMKKGPKKEIALAEYCYFSGRAEQAMRKAEPYLNHPVENYRLSACLIYAYACLSLGQIDQAAHALRQLKHTLSEAEKESGKVQPIASFAAFTASVLLHLPLPEKMPPIQEYLPLLPKGLRAFALYVQAHYLYLKEDYRYSVGLVEAALAMGGEEYPISAIYLHLVAVMDYMSLRDIEKAQYHMMAAWKKAQPDDLIEGLGEHHGLLGGMLEATIKPEWPEEFSRIIDITYRFSSGWRRVHNPVTGHDVADDLSTTEFAIAMLVSRGWSNREVADHMNISENTVKTYVNRIIKKLPINERKDIKKYMLK